MLTARKVFSRILGHLGALRTRYHLDRLADPSVQRGRALRTGGGHASDHLGAFADPVLLIAGVHTLRTEREERILSDASPIPLQDRGDHLPRRTWIGGGFQHQECTRREVRYGGLCASDDGTQVRVVVLVERGRQADDERFPIPKPFGGAAGMEVACRCHGGKRGTRNVFDVRATVRYRGDLAGIDVNAEHIIASLGEGYCQGQPDVAESDDADPCHWPDDSMASCAGSLGHLRRSHRIRGVYSRRHGTRPTGHRYDAGHVSRRDHPTQREADVSQRQFAASRSCGVSGNGPWYTRPASPGLHAQGDRPVTPMGRVPGVRGCAG